MFDTALRSFIVSVINCLYLYMRCVGVSELPRGVKWCYYVHHRDIFSRRSNDIQQLLTRSDQGSDVPAAMSSEGLGLG